MAIKKQFLEDRTALLMVSANSFLLLASSVLVLLKLNSGRDTSSYIIQCRDCSNTYDLNRFTNGTVTQILSFIAFGVMVYAFGLVLSYRTFMVKRELAYVILSLTTVLLLFSSVVVYSLLLLR